MLARLWVKRKSLPLPVGLQAGKTTFEINLGVSEKRKNPAVRLLGICPKHIPTYKKGTCSTMFIAALFIIPRSWIEPRCPSTEEWMQKNVVTEWSTTQKLKTMTLYNSQANGWNWKMSS